MAHGGLQRGRKLSRVEEEGEDTVIQLGTTPNPDPQLLAPWKLLFQKKVAQTTRKGTSKRGIKKRLGVGLGHQPILLHLTREGGHALPSTKPLAGKKVTLGQPELASRDTSGPLTCQSELRLLTWNVRGLSKRSLCYQELARLDDTISPDIIAITETRFYHSATGSKAQLRGALPRHQIWNGFAQKEDGTIMGKGGVALAIRKTLTSSKGGESLQTTERLRPYVLPVLLTSTIHAKGVLVVATYIPPGDTTLRKDICREVSLLLEAAEAQGQPAILLGDINTGLGAEDYGSGEARDCNMDHDFLQWMERHCMEPHTKAPHNRQHTFELHREDGSMYTSRLDDILLNSMARTARQGAGHERVHKDMVGSDHYPLSCTLDNGYLGIPLQPAESEQSPYCQTRNPLLQHPSRTIKARLAIPHYGLDMTVRNLTKQCTTWVENPNLLTEEGCEDMGLRIQEVFLGLQSTVSCPDIHKKPYKHWTRKMSHALKICRDDVRQAKKTLTEAHHSGGEEDIILEAKKLLNSRKKALQHTLHQEHTNRAQKVRKQALQQYLTRRKQVHRNIFRPQVTQDHPWKALEAVFHPTTGHLRTDGAGIREAVQLYMGELVCPSISPDPVQVTPPWEREGCHDPMVLREAQAGVPHVLTQLMDDKLGFYRQLHHLSKGKATGPDRLANETISGAPRHYKHLLHTYICCLWRLGYTPQTWAKSHTYLLHKKGDVRELGNYRPLAMTNTLGKVWTGALARTLSYYAEINHILSSTQEGFRARKNSLRQIRNVINAIEDAYLYHKNIYLLYVDFTSAFNMVRHDLLDSTLGKLGIPEQMRRCVRSLYARATTQFITPIGLTEVIPITRGTLQGDTLSPLLFLLYIEPLHRWLHQGGRGYAFGCLSTEENLQHRLASGGYADDLGAMTGNVRDMEIQALKISLFSIYSGLPMSVSKCAVTAGLFSLWAHEKDGTPQLRDPRVRDQLEGRIVLGKAAAPVLMPCDSYPYLGIQINMSLD